MPAIRHLGAPTNISNIVRMDVVFPDGSVKSFEFNELQISSSISTSGACKYYTFQTLNILNVTQNRNMWIGAYKSPGGVWSFIASENQPESDWWNTGGMVI